MNAHSPCLQRFNSEFKFKENWLVGVQLKRGPFNLRQQIKGEKEDIEEEPVSAIKFDWNTA